MFFVVKGVSVGVLCGGCGRFGKVSGLRPRMTIEREGSMSAYDFKAAFAVAMLVCYFAGMASGWLLYHPDNKAP